MAVPSQIIGWTTSDPRFHDPLLQQLLHPADFNVSDVLSGTRHIVLMRGIWWIFVNGITVYNFGIGPVALIALLCFFDLHLRSLIRKQRTVFTNRKDFHLLPSKFATSVVHALWARSWEFLLELWVYQQKTSTIQDSATANRVSVFLNRFAHLSWSLILLITILNPFYQVFIPNNGFAHLWWSTYLYIAYPGEFEPNYLAAFNAILPEGSQENVQAINIIVFLGHEYLSFIVQRRSEDLTDELLLKEIRMRYRLLKLRNGLTELLVPKRLRSIHYVEFDKDSYTLGRRTATLGLSPGRGVLWFRHPEITKSSRQIIEMSSGGALGLELCRSIDQKTIAAVVSVSPIAATIFAVIWIPVYVAKGDNVQAVVSAAFAVATYIFTVGTLVIALVGSDGEASQCQSLKHSIRDCC